MRTLRWTTIVACAAVVGIVLAIPAAPCAAGDLLYAGAVEFATGDYVFTERTNSVYLFNGVSWATKRVTISAGVPVIYQNTLLVSNSGAGMIPTGGGMGGATTHNPHGGMMGTTTSSTASFDDVGVGDPLIRADVAFVGGRARRYSVGVAAALKAPVADVDRGFGTGEWDYGAGMSARYAAAGYVGSATLLYWWLGEPDGFDFQNPVAYSASLSRRLGGGRFAAGASVAGYSRVIDGVDPFGQVGATLMYFPAPGRSVSATALFGLSNSAPDVGVSVGWGFAL